MNCKNQAKTARLSSTSVAVRSLQTCPTHQPVIRVKFDRDSSTTWPFSSAAVGWPLCHSTCSPPDPPDGGANHGPGHNTPHRLRRPGRPAPRSCGDFGASGGARKASGRRSRRGPASGLPPPPPITHAADPMESSVPRAASGTDTSRASSRASRRINHNGPTHDEIRIRTMSLFGRSEFVRPANVCLRCAWLLRDWVLFGIRLPDWCWRNKKSEEMLEKLTGNRCAGGTISCDARTRSISPAKTVLWESC